LSLSWCAQDPDLLLSCGKDNRALCWNPQPQTPEIIGELPAAENWAFQVDWCPGNPDLLATAFFDGTIGIHSIQATNTDSSATATPIAPSDDIFASAPTSRGTFSLTQPPKWLRRPTSASFGFGGKLITVSNLPSAQGKHQSAVVHTRTVLSDSPIVQRAEALRGDRDALRALAESKDGEVWKALAGLFGKDQSTDSAHSREELIALLGFSKEEVAAKVAEAIANVNNHNPAESTPGPSSEEIEQDIVSDSLVSGGKPVVSFVEPEPEPEPEGSEQEAESAQSEKTPSEVSVSVTSHVAGVDGESTTTAPSLFGEDNAGPAANDFFATIGAAPAETVPHTSYPLDSSVAATIGSGASSAASDSTHEGVTFRIYATDESDTDRLITQALVLGDFESAVSLCLSVNRFTDAILLAGRGGPALLARTQKAYFNKKAGDTPYLRLFQSIVDADLADVVRHADLREWREVFVVICTFAKDADFASLAEMLGRRLEQASRAKVDGGKQIRRDAETTYLAAAKLERLVDIWAEELQEEEQELLATLEGHQNAGIKYEAHATALQTFMEKVAVFRAAVNYVDSDLVTQKAETYKLVSLYERYIEYADILAAHGLLEDAVKALALVPQAYDSKLGSDARDRVLLATGRAKSSTTKAAPAPATTATVPAYGSSYLPPAVPRVPSTIPTAQNAYPYAPVSTVSAGPYSIQATQPPVVPPPPNPYAPPISAAAQPISTSPYQPVAPPPAPYRAPVQSYTPSQPNAALPPPPTRPPPPPSMPPKREAGGWNDAPAGVTRQRTPITANANKPAAIVSPFPNSMPGSPTPSQSGQSGILPPPPRPGSAQARPPPPPQVSRMSVPPPPPTGSYAPPPSHILPPGPPSRNMSPGINQGYAPPPPQANPSPYAPPTLPAQRETPLPPPPAHGPYAPPPGATPYAPPPGAAPRGGPPPPPQAVGPSPLAPPPAGAPVNAPAPPPARRGPPPPKYRA
jgi:protein transport protein SEC31